MNVIRLSLNYSSLMIVVQAADRQTKLVDDIKHLHPELKDQSTLLASGKDQNRNRHCVRIPYQIQISGAKISS